MPRSELLGHKKGARRAPGPFGELVQFVDISERATPCRPLIHRLHHALCPVLTGSLWRRGGLNGGRRRKIQRRNLRSKPALVRLQAESASRDRQSPWPARGLRLG